MSSRRQVETYTNGTVVVNMIDAKSKQVIWQGEVTDVVNLPIWTRSALPNRSMPQWRSCSPSVLRRL